MSSYENFFHDFPNRSLRLLSSFYGEAKVKNLEVTFLIQASYGLLLIPFERLRMDHEPHPSGDSSLQLSRELTEVLACPFLDKFGLSATEWFIGKVEKFPVESKEIANADFRQITKKKQSKSVIKIIRNALAHANLATLDNPIEKIVFYSESWDKEMPLKKYNLIRTTPDEYLSFLTNWIKLLNEFKGSEKEIAQILGSGPT